MNWENALGIALGFYTSYEDNLSNVEALQALENEDWDNITPWQYVEDWGGETLASHVASIAEALMFAYNQGYNNGKGIEK
jgi:hypothetical protein